MIVFGDLEFEIAIVTYNRPDFVHEWLNKCYEAAAARNIKVSVYDSSPNNKTKDVIEKFNADKKKQIEYNHIHPDTLIGYKPMLPILASRCEYVWVSGDSRYHDFEELDEKVFHYIKDKNVDYIALGIVNNFKNDGKIYTDKSEMLHDFFISSTCIGLSIYRIDIFNPIKSTPDLLNMYNELFSVNYGFGWLGYFYNVYALGEYKALFANVKLFNVQVGKKIQSWAKRFYGCWADDLCQIIDNIPDSYVGKELVPWETWRTMRLDSIQYCYRARTYGDLNKQKYLELLSNGILSRLTNKTKRICFFACAPKTVIMFVSVLEKVGGKIFNVYGGGK